MLCCFFCRFGRLYCLFNLLLVPYLWQHSCPLPTLIVVPYITILGSYPPPPPPPPPFLALRLSTPPETLDELGDSLALQDQLQADLPNMEAQFEPLNDQFNILRKYEVMISEEVEVQLAGLQTQWMNFQQCLINASSMLKKHKVCY